jgi:hypothetical protein
LQLRRLQKLDQPLEQLDEVIEDIRRLMLRSAETASKEQLGRRKEEAAASSRRSSSSRMEQMESSKDLFGIQEDFQQLEGKLMSRSS